MYYGNVALIVMGAIVALFVVDRYYNSGLIFMFRKRKNSPAYRLVDLLIQTRLEDGSEYYLEDLFAEIYPICPKIYRNNRYFFERVFNDVINDKVEEKTYKLLGPYEDALCLASVEAS